MANARSLFITILAWASLSNFQGSCCLIAADPQTGSSSAYCREADVLLARGKYRLAIKNYTRAIELNKNNAEAYVNRC
jgi:tetratricopeptide (TPR) repeat protein